MLSEVSLIGKKEWGIVAPHSQCLTKNGVEMMLRKGDYVALSSRKLNRIASGSLYGIPSTPTERNRALFELARR